MVSDVVEIGRQPAGFPATAHKSCASPFAFTNLEIIK